MGTRAPWSLPSKFFYCMFAPLTPSVVNSSRLPMHRKRCIANSIWWPCRVVSELSFELKLNRLNCFASVLHALIAQSLDTTLLPSYVLDRFECSNTYGRLWQKSLLFVPLRHDHQEIESLLVSLLFGCSTRLSRKWTMKCLSISWLLEIISLLNWTWTTQFHMFIRKTMSNWIIEYFMISRDHKPNKSAKRIASFHMIHIIQKTSNWISLDWSRS